MCAQVEMLQDRCAALYARPLAATLEEYVRTLQSARVAFSARYVSTSRAGALTSFSLSMDGEGLVCAQDDGDDGI
jgi:hypothetical protein